MNSHQRYLMKQRLEHITVELTEFNEQMWSAKVNEHSFDTAAKAGSSTHKQHMLRLKVNELVDAVNDIRKILYESSSVTPVDEIIVKAAQPGRSTHV